MKVLSKVEGHEPQVIKKSAGLSLREPLVIQFSQYRGRDRVSMRFHYWDDDGDLAPGRRGVEFATTMLDDVISALQKVKEELEE